jgi:hypothetical protein
MNRELHTSLEKTNFILWLSVEKCSYEEYAKL